MTDEADRVRPLLDLVMADEALDLIVSLIGSDDEEMWLKEQIADALRD